MCTFVYQMECYKTRLSFPWNSDQKPYKKTLLGGEGVLGGLRDFEDLMVVEVWQSRGWCGLGDSRGLGDRGFGGLAERWLGYGV